MIVKLNLSWTLFTDFLISFYFNLNSDWNQMIEEENDDFQDEVGKNYLL